MKDKTFPEIPMDRVDGMGNPVCGVCWTSSWQPCEEGVFNAVKDDSTGGWMVCGMCVHTDAYYALAKLFVDNVDPLSLSSEDAKKWRTWHKQFYPENYR